MLIPTDAIPFIRQGVPRLGKPTLPSPISEAERGSEIESAFQPEGERVLVSPLLSGLSEVPDGEEPLSYEVAGPRSKIYFDAKTTKAAIVTCGGLCPGLNDVIRRIVMTLYHQYGLSQIYGIRYGYRGLVETKAEVPMLLTPDAIEPISNDGGSFLGTSRGNQDPIEMVDFLGRRGIRILFTIGGDGTQKGALAISHEAENRGYELSVIGLPKTIDNDIGLVEKTFGFDTAVSVAAEVLRGAHVEAESERNGVVIVKLMGRQSGFLATHASIASGDVNFILIPEIPVSLEGDHGLFATLQKRLENRGHALIVVAEGMSEKITDVPAPESFTERADRRSSDDVGIYLKDRIAEYFKRVGFEARVRYIDPSYYVRSLPAIPTDSIFCQNLAHHAVHAAMAGYTRMLVATCNGVYCYIPLEAVGLHRRFVNPQGPLWRSALETTGQPARMTD